MDLVGFHITELIRKAINANLNLNPNFNLQVCNAYVGNEECVQEYVI